MDNEIRELHELVSFYEDCIREQPDVHYWTEKQCEILNQIEIIMDDNYIDDLREYIP